MGARGCLHAPPARHAPPLMSVPRPTLMNKPCGFIRAANVSGRSCLGSGPRTKLLRVQEPDGVRRVRQRAHQHVALAEELVERRRVARRVHLLGTGAVGVPEARGGELER